MLHFTDVHAQLKPVYFRPPSENFGVGDYEGIPPHLVGEEFLKHFGIEPGSALAYAHTMVDYVNLARSLRPPRRPRPHRHVGQSYPR